MVNVKWGIDEINGKFEMRMKTVGKKGKGSVCRAEIKEKGVRQRLRRQNEET